MNMPSREEQIKAAADEYFSTSENIEMLHYRSNSEDNDKAIFIEGAKWADKNPERDENGFSWRDRCEIADEAYKDLKEKIEEEVYNFIRPYSKDIADKWKYRNYKSEDDEIFQI